MNGTRGDVLPNPNVKTGMSEPELQPLEHQKADDKHKSFTEKALAWAQTNLLFILTLVAVALGLIIGVIVQQTVRPYSTDLVVVLLKFPGELLLRMLKCLILPLVIASVITGLGAINPKSSGKIGGTAVAYYLSTTVFAVTLGLFLVSAIRPGVGKTYEYQSDDSLAEHENANSLDTILDLLRGAFPANIVQATFGKDYTEITKKNVTGHDKKVYEATFRKVKFNDSGMNMIGIIVFSVVCGVVMSFHPEESEPLMKVIQAVNDLTMRLVQLVLWYSPIGIMFLIAGQFSGVENFGEMASRLGMYMVTVLTGIAIHFVLVLPSIYFVVTRRNPIKFYINMLPALATAFGTDSSSATMPVTLQCVEDRNNINRKITRFVIPVGATINMDGTALYEAVACIFIAQTLGRSLSFGEILVTGLTATLAAIGAAGIPSAGLVTMIMVLNAVNLPTDMISVLFTVDWFLDRFRTITNVMGDAIGCAVVQKFCQAELDSMGEEEDINDGHPKMRENLPANKLSAC